MSDQLDTSTPRKRFPKWSRNEQDLWTDFFEIYSELLMQGVIDKVIDKNEPPRCSFQEALEDSIKLAAELTDKAVAELQYRFWIQQPKKGRKRRPKAQKRKTKSKQPIHAQKRKKSR